MKRRALLALLPTAVSLAGCGFRPVYMPTASGKPGVAQRELAATEVAIIAERPGQLLRQALQNRFASDAGPSHRYILSADFAIAGEGVGILIDNSASRVRLIGSVNWVLRARDTGRAVLTSGSARTLDGFNLFSEQYFGATLENEAAQRRMAEALADQIALQLATWFNRRAEAAAG
ncbi:MAG: LPS assembly lipoprotein LptE [Rhodospirillales bacterium]